MIKKVVFLLLLTSLLSINTFAQEYFLLEPIDIGLSNNLEKKTHKVKANKRIGIQADWDEYYKGRLLDVFNDSLLLETRREGNLIFAIEEIDELYIYKYHRFSFCPFLPIQISKRIK